MTDFAAIVREKLPCRHRGEKTGEMLAGCGCHASEWKKELYACALYGECVLLQIKKLPSKRNCQSCLNSLSVI